MSYPQASNLFLRSRAPGSFQTQASAHNQPLQLQSQPPLQSQSQSQQQSQSQSQSHLTPSASTRQSTIHFNAAQNVSTSAPRSMNGLVSSSSVSSSAPLAPTVISRQGSTLHTAQTSDITEHQILGDEPLNEIADSKMIIASKVSGPEEDTDILWSHINLLIIYGLHMSAVATHQRELTELDMIRQLHDFANVWIPVMETHVLPLKLRWPIDKDVCKRLPHLLPQKKQDDEVRMRDVVRFLVACLRNQLRSAQTLTREMLVPQLSQISTVDQHESMDVIRSARDNTCKIYAHVQFALQWIQQLFIEYAPEHLCGLGLQQEIDRRMRCNANQLQSSTDFVHYMGFKLDRTFFTGDL